MMLKVLLTWAVVATTVAAEPVTVHTRYGSLRGLRTELPSGAHVDQYLGVPFAKPPVGALRFHKPVENEAWIGTRDATTQGCYCPQPPIRPPTSWNITRPMDEDCLYLNVFTPKMSGGNKSLPVMVWIHGGGYVMGTGIDMDLSAMASQGVVAVSINYRLAALGFLSLEDQIMPGNYGILDQIRALEWVRDVIADFNGDPKNVTIFGQSAGAGSVSMLILSSKANGLFHKAILESGGSEAPWSASYLGNDPQAKDVALKVLSAIQCNSSNSTEVLACLRTRDVDSILNASAKISEELNNVLIFRPVVDARFEPQPVFNGTPDVIYRHGSFNNVTVMRGFCKDEIGNDPSIDKDGMTLEEFKNRTQDFVQNTVLPTSSAHPSADRITYLLMNTYLRDGATARQLRDTFSRMMSDFEMDAPILKETALAAKAHAKTQYLYRFSYRSANRLGHLWQGVGHGDEVNYVMGYPLLNSTFWNIKFVSSWTHEDIRMAECAMTLWTNFAKHGNPTPDNAEGLRWLPWELATPRLLEMNSVSKMTDYPDSAGVRLWNDVIGPMLKGDTHSGVIG